MRKIILIAAMCLCVSLFTGCDMINNKASLGDKAEGEKHGYEGADITYISGDDRSLTVLIENNSESTWQSGNMKDYSLEAYKNGAWYTVEQIGEFANTMELMIFAPGNTLEHTFRFENRYGILAPGLYRVVKSYWANKTETDDAREFHLICEFRV